jgi:thiamine-phosphate pyrophosphorylase
LKLRLPLVYPILDTVAIARTGLNAVEAAEALLEGGAEILQYRHKAFWSRDTLAEAETIARLCRGAGALFIINDRADYAAMLGAGLHVGQEDLTPADARRVIGSEAILGFSTHDPGQMTAAQSEPVDYVAFGPVFATDSKERLAATVRVAGLAAVRALTSKPLVAIGGITQDRAPACWNAGADSVAIIGGMMAQVRTRTALRDRMTEWRRLSGRRAPTLHGF